MSNGEASADFRKSVDQKYFISRVSSCVSMLVTYEKRRNNMKKKKKKEKHAAQQLRTRFMAAFWGPAIILEPFCFKPSRRMYECAHTRAHLHEPGRSSAIAVRLISASDHIPSNGPRQFSIKSDTPPRYLYVGIAH